MMWIPYLRGDVCVRDAPPRPRWDAGRAHAQTCEKTHSAFSRCDSQRLSSSALGTTRSEPTMSSWSSDRSESAIMRLPKTRGPVTMHGTPAKWPLRVSSNQFAGVSGPALYGFSV